MNEKIVSIVDDEIPNRYLLRIKIEDYQTAENRINVYEATNGLEAITITNKLMNNKKEISLIFMDWKMPVLNGEEAAKKIKDQYKNIPIILHSAHMGINEIYKSSNCFNSCLEKPINEIKFQEILERYVI